LSVNGVNVENVEHDFVIRLLKEAKDFIHLVIKRKILNNKNLIDEKSNSIEQITDTKRHNLAIQQTAAKVMENYTNNYQLSQNPKSQISSQQITKSVGENRMSTMINSSHSMSSLKPIKISFNRKDKKEPYGIVVGCKYFIKEIVPNSLASLEPNLRVGDILLKLNDFEIEQISLLEANRILSKTKENKLNLLVKRASQVLLNSSDEEDMIHEINESENMNSLPEFTAENKTDSTDSNNKLPPPPLPPTLPPTEPQHNGSSTLSGCVIRQLFKPANKTNFYSIKNNAIHALNNNLRTVVFARENGIGIRLAGGNKVGIFICDVQYNSPAERAGLRVADKIIKVNGVDYLSITREEAVQHILSIHSLIEMCVSHSQDEYESNAFDPHGGDSFYVRAHYNYLSKDTNELSFTINDILHVTDTLYNGVIGQWVASKLNTKMNDNCEQQFVDIRGIVPNEQNSNSLVQAAKTIDQVISEADYNESGTTNSALKEGGGNAFATLGASARMSIRKRLGGGKNSLAKRSRSASRIDSLAAESASSQTITSSAKISKPNTFSSNKYSAFERVVLREVNFSRPIVIFGPLADVAREKLKSEFPTKYEIPESYSTNPNDPAQSSSQSSGVIKLASIKAIIEKNKHSLLDITPNAVDHLNYAQYFPICIYLKSSSRNQTKELRQKYAKNLKAKSSRRLHDNSIKLENYYSHLFTASLNLDSNQWFKKLKDLIEQQQNQPVWISEDLDKQLNNNEHILNEEMKAKLNATSQFNSNVNHPEMMVQNQVFDDNFEFPLYNSANQALSMMSGAASTYSLYEESANYNCNGNNIQRSSFAASDSDICGSSICNHQQQQNGQQKQPDHTPIYSTNFNYHSKSANSTPIHQNGTNNNDVATSLSASQHYMMNMNNSNNYMNHKEENSYCQINGHFENQPLANQINQDSVSYI
jgi:tight junction protein 1